MLIACPSCAAAYQVPALRLKPGKLVRCARCGHDWLPDPEDAVPPQASVEQPLPHDEPEAEPVTPMPELTAMDRLAAMPRLRPAHTGLIAAWVLTFVILTAAVAAAIGWRATIVRVWPPSSRIFATSTQTMPAAAQPKLKKPE